MRRFDGACYGASVGRNGGQVKSKSIAFQFSARNAAGIALMLALSFGSCKSKPSVPLGPKPQGVAEPKAAVPPPAPRATVRLPPRTPLPLGPSLLVTPGKGLGPIRFGATFATIERHMDLPCELRTENLCRYLSRAVDFEMKDGVLVSLHVQSWLRIVDPKNPEQRFGMFNGGISPDLRLGMLPWAIEAALGKATRVETVSGQAPLVEVHHYPGMLLEYDRLENDKLVLSGIRLAPNLK